jgi:membrane-bound lytic murein transglycosylase B
LRYPAVKTRKERCPMRMMFLPACLLACWPAFAQTDPQEVSVTAPPPIATQHGLDQWVSAFRPRALAAGITEQTFTAAMARVTLDPDVIEKDRNQGEFTRTIWDYLDRAVSDLRIANGQEMLARHAALLDRIEAAYQVDREVVLAVWGLESSFGAFMGDKSAVASLTTLAYEGRRAAFFEGELIAALRIIQEGNVTVDRMTGSWAGAMGHTQFMPSSYLRTAVDFTGDGRRDIWGADPADALASTAAYLQAAGWAYGKPWGMEVILPAGYDHDLSGEGVVKPVAEWAALGIALPDGDALPDHGPARLLLPAGHRGAAFLTFANFQAIEAYNPADAYVIGIGHLADRIAGGPAIRHPWPREDRALQLAERVELQQLLMDAGFDAGGADGKVGPKTVAAVKAFQRAQGLVPDGYANPALLERLRSR